jgi:hypothetical protein
LLSFFKRRKRRKTSKETIHRTLDLADKMLSLADEGEATRDDVNGGVLFGVLRDSGYKIKSLAEAAIAIKGDRSGNSG